MLLRCSCSPLSLTCMSQTGLSNPIAVKPRCQMCIMCIAWCTMACLLHMLSTVLCSSCGRVGGRRAQYKVCVASTHQQHPL